MAARPPEFGEQTDEVLKEFDFNADGVQPTPAENRVAHPDRQSCGSGFHKPSLRHREPMFPENAPLVRPSPPKEAAWGSAAI
jgi:hypothetical protein